jgi:hypothetical protein
MLVITLHDVPVPAAVRIRTAPKVLLRCRECDEPITRYVAPHLGEPGGPGPVYVVAEAADPERLEDGRLRFRCPRRWPVPCGEVAIVTEGVVAALVIAAARAGQREVTLDESSAPQIRAIGDEILIPPLRAMIRDAASVLRVDTADLAAIIVRHYDQCGELIDPRSIVASLQRMAEAAGISDPRRADIPAMCRDLSAYLSARDALVDKTRV